MKTPIEILAKEILVSDVEKALEVIKANDEPQYEAVMELLLSAYKHVVLNTERNDLDKLSNGSTRVLLNNLKQHEIAKDDWYRNIHAEDLELKRFTPNFLGKFIINYNKNTNVLLKYLQLVLDELIKSLRAWEKEQKNKYNEKSIYERITVRSISTIYNNSIVGGFSEVFGIFSGRFSKHRVVKYASKFIGGLSASALIYYFFGIYSSTKLTIASTLGRYFKNKGVLDDKHAQVIPQTLNPEPIVYWGTMLGVTVLEVYFHGDHSSLAYFFGGLSFYLFYKKIIKPFIKLLAKYGVIKKDTEFVLKFAVSTTGYLCGGWYAANLYNRIFAANHCALDMLEEELTLKGAHEIKTTLSRYFFFKRNPSFRLDYLDSRYHPHSQICEVFQMQVPCQSSVDCGEDILLLEGPKT